MLNPAAAARRAIPSLDRLLQLGAVEDLAERYGRPLVTEAARAELAALRCRPRPPHPRSSRRLRRSAFRSGLRRAPRARDAVLAQAGLQSHGYGAPHQSRARAHATGGRAGRRACDDAPGQPRVRAGRGRSRRARPPCRALAHAADRREGGAGRQQQCRGGLPRAEHPRAEERGAGIARGADRDRRCFPHPRHHVARRREACRSRHDQPHSSQGLFRRDLPAHGRADESAHQQLRGPGIHGGGSRRQARRARAPAPIAAHHRSRQRHAGESRGLRLAARAHAARGARRGRRCRHLQRRQTARRPAGGADRRAPGLCRAHPKEPDEARAACGQDDARGAGGGAAALRRSRAPEDGAAHAEAPYPAGRRDRGAGAAAATGVRVGPAGQGQRRSRSP